MIYHKSIELDGWKSATEQVYTYVKDHTQFLNKQSFFWNTLSRIKHQPCYDALAPVFKSAGFDLLRVSFLIITRPVGEIHADHADTSTYSYPAPTARINLPVLNCEHSETRFYSPLKWDPIIKKLNNGVKYEYHTAGNCKLESATTLTGPTILRVRELHNVVVTTPMYPRISLTCDVGPDPVYLLEEN